MRLFMLWSKEHHRPVRYGENGGGELGFCLFRGYVVVFPDRAEAENIRAGFDNPAEYSIIEFR